MALHLNLTILSRWHSRQLPGNLFKFYSTSITITIMKRPKKCFGRLFLCFIYSAFLVNYKFLVDTHKTFKRFVFLIDILATPINNFVREINFYSFFFSKSHLPILASILHLKSFTSLRIIAVMHASNLIYMHEAR